MSEMIEVANRMALRLCGRDLIDTAEDISVRAVTAVVRRLRDGEVEVANLAGYLVTAVKNAFRSDARAAARRRELLQRLIPISELTPSHELPLTDRAEVESLFARLGEQRPRMKDAQLVLRAQELISAGYSQTEAADLLGITRENLVKKLRDYSRAVIELRDQEDGER